MASQRNYQAEYARRLERALARGLSRSQARGHAKPSEAPIKPKRVKTDTATLEAALKSLYSGGSLQRAAADNHVSVERLRKYLSDQGLAKRAGRKWIVTDERQREMTVMTDGRARSLILKNLDSASLNGRHLAAVGQFLDSNNAYLLTPFVGLSVADSSGATHILETDPNALYRIANSGSQVFEHVYRLIQ